MFARGRRSVLSLLAAIAVVLLAYPFLQSLRAGGYSEASSLTLVVSSSADSGPGSLRSALFQALKSDVPVGVVIDVPVVTLRNRLPTLSGAVPLSISGSGPEPAKIEAPEVSPLFEISGQPVTLARMEIAAPVSEAIRVSNGGYLATEDVVIRFADIGIAAYGEHEISVTQSAIRALQRGIVSTGQGAVRISGVTVSGYDDAGIWIVHEPGFGRSELVDVSTDGGRYGLVLVETESRVRRVSVTAATIDGVTLYGGRADILELEVRNSDRAGLRIIGAASGRVGSSEFADNAGAAVLIQTSETFTVEGNRVYRNGLGIATVLTPRLGGVRISGNIVFSQLTDGIAVVGDSPVITSNRSFSNRLAGLRLYAVDYQSHVVRANPLLDSNQFSDNGVDAPLADTYLWSPAE